MPGLRVRPSGRRPHAGDADRPLVLRDTVEAFPSSDGNIYLMRGGTDAEYVVEHPTALERAVIELIHAPMSRAELLAELAALGHRATEDEVCEILDQLLALGLVDCHPPAYPGLRAQAVGLYDRQLAYFADLAGPGRPAAEAQGRLLGASVVVLGCGGLGSWTAAALACAGIGRLVLVDDDAVELSNLNRQILFKRDDIGRPKVDAAARALHAFNPDLDLQRVRARISGSGDVARLAADAALVVATADHPPFEIARWVNRGCWRAGVPHVSAAQFPPLVRIGPLFRPGVTGCHACHEEAARAASPDYDALLAYRARRTVNAATLGPPSALVGSVIAMDAVHLITGLGEPSTQGTALLVDLRTMAVEREDVVADPHCEICSEHAPREAVR